MDTLTNKDLIPGRYYTCRGYGSNTFTGYQFDYMTILHSLDISKRYAIDLCGDFYYDQCCSTDDHIFTEATLGEIERLVNISDGVLSYTPVLTYEIF